MNIHDVPTGAGLVAVGSTEWWKAKAESNAAAAIVARRERDEWRREHNWWRAKAKAAEAKLAAAREAADGYVIGRMGAWDELMDALAADTPDEGVDDVKS